jgi:hypothetical protein
VACRSNHAINICRSGRPGQAPHGIADPKPTGPSYIRFIALSDSFSVHANDAAERVSTKIRFLTSVENPPGVEF